MSNIRDEFKRKTSRDEQTEFLLDKIVELGVRIDALGNVSDKSEPESEPESAKTDAATA